MNVHNIVMNIHCIVKLLYLHESRVNSAVCKRLTIQVDNWGVYAWSNKSPF